MSTEMMHQSSLGQRIRSRRKELHLTQVELGGRLNMSAANVSLIEKDQNILADFNNRNMLGKVAKALGLSKRKLEKLRTKRPHVGVRTSLVSKTEFGNFLIHQRSVVLKLSRQELKRLSGLNYTHIVRWEEGVNKRRPKKGELKRLAKALQTSLKELESLTSSFPENITRSKT